MKKQNIIGQTFGQLIVIDEAESKHGLSQWVCKCSCGNTTTVSRNSLMKGTTKSCGCYRKEASAKSAKIRSTTHGDFGTRLYSIYLGMRKRCYTQSCTAYKGYGAKGILVSDQWDTYEKFKEWAMNSGYSDDLTLDRMDSAKNYSPENCRWVNYEAQIRNRRKQLKVASSKYIGVSWNKSRQKWVAYITVTKNTILLGYFDDEVSAAKARDSFIKENQLEHFKLNF